MSVGSFGRRKERCWKGRYRKGRYDSSYHLQNLFVVISLLLVIPVVRASAFGKSDKTVKQLGLGTAKRSLKEKNNVKNTSRKLVDQNNAIVEKLKKKKKKKDKKKEGTGEEVVAELPGDKKKTVKEGENEIGEENERADESNVNTTNDKDVKVEGINEAEPDDIEKHIKILAEEEAIHNSTIIKLRGQIHELNDTLSNLMHRKKELNDTVIELTRERIELNGTVTDLVRRKKKLKKSTLELDEANSKLKNDSPGSSHVVNEDQSKDPQEHEKKDEEQERKKTYIQAPQMNVTKTDEELKLTENNTNTVDSKQSFFPLFFAFVVTTCIVAYVKRDKIPPPLRDCTRRFYIFCKGLIDQAMAEIENGGRGSNVVGYGVGGGVAVSEMKSLKMSDSDIEGGDWDWDGDVEDEQGKDVNSSFRRSSQSLAVKRSSSFSSSDGDNKAIALKLQGKGKNINIRHSAASQYSSAVVTAPKKPLPSKPMTGFGNKAPTSMGRPPIASVNPIIRSTRGSSLSKPNDSIFASMGMQPLGSTNSSPVRAVGIERPPATSLGPISFEGDEMDGSWGDDDGLEDDLFESESD